MHVMNLLRKVRLAAALPAIACLAGAGLAIAPAAQAVSASPARFGAAGLRVTGKIDLGRLGSSLGYAPSEAPNGDVYYALGSVVYRVSGDHAPVAALKASQPVLAVAATSADLLVDTGLTVSAYALGDHRLLGTWTLPPSPEAVTSAGLYLVGSTVWAYTDWATDQSGLEFANVSRFGLSSPAVHLVSTIAYPGYMAADPAGLYYQGSSGNSSYVFRALPSGALHKRTALDIDVPLALAAGNVYLLGAHGGHNHIDAFDGSTLGSLFSYQVADTDTDIAGTGAGLLLLGAGTVSLLNPANGHADATLSVPGAVILVPGPSAVVVTVSHSRTYLLRLAR